MSIKKEESMLEFDRKVPSVMKMEPTDMDLITVAGPCKPPTSVLSGSNFPSSAPWYQMPGNKVTPIDSSHNTNTTYPYFAAHCLASNAFDPGEESNKTMEPTGTPTFHIVDTALDLRMHQNTYAGLCVPQEQAAAFDAQNPVTYWNDCNEECETTAKLMCSFAFPDSVQLEPLAALQSQFAPKVAPQESRNSGVPELISALRSVLFTQYFRAWYNYTLMDQPSLIPISSSRWSVMQPEYHMQNNYQVPSLCSSDSASNVLGRLLDTTNSLTSSLWNSALSHVNDQGEVFATAEAFCNRYSPPLNFSAFAMDQNMLCPICRKCFRFEKNLLRHLQKAHATGTGESVLKCKLCNYTTRHYSNMYVHIRTHTGDKPYTCSACGVSFTQGSSLKLHIKSRHHDNASYFSLTRKPGKNNLTKLWTRVLKKDLPKYNSLLSHSMITVNEMATIRSTIKPELLWSGFHAISSLKHKERHPGEKYFGTFDRLSTATSQLQASSTPKLSSSGDMYTENRTGGEELAPDTTLQPFGSPYGEADFMYNWSQTANLSGLSCSTLIPKHSSDRTWARFRVEQRNTRKIKKRRTLPIALKAIESNVDGENPVNKASNADLLRPQTDATFPVFDSPSSSANTIATCVSDDNHSELRKLDANEQLKPEFNENETEYLQCGLKRSVTSNTVTRECHPFSIAALQTSAEKHFAG